MKLCTCGCGLEITSIYKDTIYIKGHWAKTNTGRNSARNQLAKLRIDNPNMSKEICGKVLSDYINNHPNHQSKAATFSLKRLNKFKKEHYNLSPIEWKFFTHKANQLLYNCGLLIINDLRFWPYQMDFTIPDANINIELDHPDWHDKEKDQIRDKFLNSQGWKIVRFTNKEVEDNIEEVINKIKDLI
jgi:very-short-patch-repair endonuclease